MRSSSADEFLRRDWPRATASKGAYWAGRFQEEGWRAGWDAAQSLLAHVRRVRPDFPSERDRALDFSHHLMLCARLDQAARAFARR